MSDLTCLIGIRGAKRAGKDSIARFIMEHFAWTTDLLISHRNFADNLKESIALIFGFDKDQVFSDDFKNAITHVKDPVDGSFMTGRRLLQYFGTETCRNMDQDCWVRGPGKWFKDRESDIGVISDLRFMNEVEYLRECDVPNFIIKVERPGYNGDGHESERALDNFEEDDFIIINSGDLLDLKAEATKIARIIEERIASEVN